MNEKALTHATPELSYRVLAETIPQQVWTARPDGTLDYVNSVVLRYFDRTSSEILGTGWLAFVHPDDVETCLARWSRSLSSGEDYEIEFRLRDRAGAYRFHLGRAVPERDEGGNVVRWFGTNTDIDDRKQAAATIELQRAALAERAHVSALADRARLHSFLMQAPAGMAVLEGEDLVFTLANPRYLQFIGNRPLLGKPLLVAMPELEGQGYDVLLRQVLRTGEPYIGKEMMSKLDREGTGTLMEGYFDFVYEPVRGHAGSVESVMIMAFDVTERVMVRRAMEAARKATALSEERFQLLTEVLPQIVWAMSPDGTCTYLSPPWYAYTGQSPEDESVDRWREAIHPDDYDMCFDVWNEAAEKRQLWELEYRLRRHDGAYCWHLGRSLPHCDEHGNILHWYGTATNIDAQRRAIRSRDDLLATVSHDLRNPLGSIRLATELLRGEASETGKRQLGAIERATVRMDELLRDLLDMASIESSHLQIEPVALRVSDVLDDAVDAMRLHASAKDVGISTPLAPPLLSVLGDRGRVLQVFSNVLGNAVKFTPRGGHVTVDVKLIDARFVEFAITDTGSGIDEADLPRVFDRFWQSKETARAGTGLGLAISKGIVEQHGGKIRVESTVGRGTTFAFTLPVTAF